MRIVIIGNSGSGKSTLSRQLAAAHALTALDLDTIAWEPGQIAVPRSADDAQADVAAFCDTHPRWVIEGCYAGLVQHVLGHWPILVFMDPGVDACLANCRSRPWEPHKYASRAEQDSKLEFLLSWVRDYYTRDGDLSIGAHHALFDSYNGPKQRLTQRADRVIANELAARWYSDRVEDYAARFQSLTLHKHEWTHWAHLTVGLWHVDRYGADDALVKLRSGIRRLNESLGGVNTSTNGYHETITAAYVTLVAQFLRDGSKSEALCDRVRQLLCSPLAEKNVLFSYYSRDRLFSTTARAEWVEPDIAPLAR